MSEHDVNEKALKEAQSILEDVYVVETYEHKEYVRLLQNLNSNSRIIDVTRTV